MKRNQFTKNGGAILVVDDESESLKLMARLLVENSYQVRIAESGEQALRSMALRPTDLVIMDICLPGMDGIETCRRLKAKEETRTIPVIFLSALYGTSDKLNAFAAGGVDYLCKPFSTEEFLIRVRTHITLYRLQQRLEKEIEMRTQRLRDSEQRIRLLLTSVAEGIYTIDREGRCIIANPACANLLGYESPEQMTGQAMHELIHHSLPDGSPNPVSACPIHRVMQKGQSSKGEDQWFCRADRSYIPVEYRAVPMLDNDKVVGAVISFWDISERKAIEQSLLEGRRQLEMVQSAINKMQDAAFLIGINGRFFYVNEIASRRLGYSVEELLEMGVSDVDPDFPSSRWPQTVAALREQGNLFFESQHRSRDGSLFPVEISATRYSYGDEEYFIAIVRDISARKSMERKLRESEHRYRDLMQGLHVAIVVHQADTAIIDFNQRALDLLGLSADQMKGRKAFHPDWCFVDDDGHSLAPKQYPVNRVLTERKALRNGVMGIRIPEREDIVWVLVNADPVWSEGGEIDQIRVSFIDITEKKRAEDELAHYQTNLEYLVKVRTKELEHINAELREQISSRKQAEDSLVGTRERLSFMFEYAGDALFVANSDGRFLDVNPSACRLLGYSREELLEMPIADIDYEFNTRAEERKLWTGDSLAHSTVLETTHHRRDGTTYPAEVALSMQWMDGQMLMFAIVRNIELRKQFEASLREAKEAAEEANRAKSTFLANMSHELRTPLNAILGFTQLVIHDEQIPSSERQYLDIISRNGQHLLTLINEVLEISKIEAGRLSANVEPLDLHEMLTKLADMMRVRAQEKGLSLHLEYQKNLLRYIQTDIVKLRQILINLLSNAVKFTEKGDIQIKVTSTQESGQPLLTFEVSDTGPGIAGNDKERVFKAFYQTDLGRKVNEGTGLGLTICREYAELLGGDLSVESEPGQGSVFRLQLPVELANTIIPNKNKHSRVVGLAPGQPTYRILVAEDNLDNQRLINTLLERVGYNVHCVSNGHQAVSEFEQWQPHFIWMDMRMPVLDGYKATQRIRSMQGGKKVKIAALTASAFEEDREVVLEAGCDAFVRKPIKPIEIFEVMHDLIGVNHICAENTPEAGIETDAVLDISELPADIVSELHEASVSLDVEGVNSIIARIHTSLPDLSKALQSSVNDFRFDRILAAIDQHEG